jgi:hypothetical protein
VVSEKTDVVSEKTDVVSVFPMWYRYARCGIGIFPLRAFSDTTSEIISNRAVKKTGDFVTPICIKTHQVLCKVNIILINL